MVDDLRDWTGSKHYDQKKIADEKIDLHATFATHSSERNKYWMNEWMNKWMNEWMNERTNEWMYCLWLQESLDSTT